MRFLTLAQQAASLAVIDDLATKHPDLPGAYIVVNNVGDVGFDVQVRWLDDFERWREALGADEAYVVIQGGFIEVTTTIAGTQVHLYATTRAAEQ